MSDSESSSSELRYESGNTSPKQAMLTRNEKQEQTSLRWINMNNN